MMKAFDLPQNLWGEAVRHSVYVLNRVTTIALKSVTPYEILKGKKPNIEHLRVFGCLTHMKVPSVNLKKLDDRSKQVVHFGIEHGTKAYRLYHPLQNKIYVSRDVKFEENKTMEWEKIGESMNIGMGTEWPDGPPSPARCEAENSAESEQPDGPPSSAHCDHPSYSRGVQTNTPVHSSQPITDQGDDHRKGTESFKVRRSTRQVNAPKHLEDYVILQEDYMTSDNEPVNYYEAKVYKEWMEAMRDELVSIEVNRT
ncbi:hypothetical protein L1987_38558 [Smallanthus sonchifolius]|uniref:Uncharacterized protein n=1 Tax=Smallanthus sonchifolius TaxID=185202 RepID=A0ACB9HKF7_9ASTR|nr:hypothetical protein L1987_38558 [Smallanthus sonchifolius]